MEHNNGSVGAFDKFILEAEKRLSWQIVVLAENIVGNAPT